MDRRARLDHARSKGWVASYPGKNIIKGYSQWFAVDAVCAVAELRMLGVAISEEREAEVRATALGRAEAGKRRRAAAAEEACDDFCAECDDRFAYIAGHTPAGAAYGVTWEEIGGETPWCEEEDAEPAARPKKGG